MFIESGSYDWRGGRRRRRGKPSPWYWWALLWVIAENSAILGTGLLKGPENGLKIFWASLFLGAIVLSVCYAEPGRKTSLDQWRISLWSICGLFIGGIISAYGAGYPDTAQFLLCLLIIGLITLLLQLHASPQDKQ